MKHPILSILLFFSVSSFAQDTLLLKISNLQPYYESCGCFSSYSTTLLGKLADAGGSETGRSETIYKIDVSCPAFLNRVAKKSDSIYRVVLRRKFYKGPFANPMTENQYSLIDIR